jgi:hypothetical protein
MTILSSGFSIKTSGARNLAVDSAYRYGRMWQTEPSPLILVVFNRY